MGLRTVSELCPVMSFHIHGVKYITCGLVHNYMHHKSYNVVKCKI
jgi:hypothetical protein